MGRSRQRVPMTGAYRFVMAINVPVMRWSRLTVTGLDCLPTSGPVLVVANHNSYWDPIAIAVGARGRRQLRAMAKSTLWKFKPIGWLMNGMGHIPIYRNASNEFAMDTCTTALKEGIAIGVFPEGTRSLGRPLRARSGAGRLALSVPEATIVCARAVGTTDVVRFPKRPSIRVDFFLPASGQTRPDESAQDLMTRLLDELRVGAPPVIPGRKRTAGKHRAKLAS